MNTQLFDRAVDNQLEKCLKTLERKSSEYAPDDDRLSAFHRAAVLQGCSPRQALAGMMAKHLVSIADLCAAKTEAALVVWDEKLTDAINYLLLLSALVHEKSLTNRWDEGDAMFYALREEASLRRHKAEGDEAK